MSYHVPPLDTLIERLNSLPNIGYKSAGRLAFYLLGADEETVNELITAITAARAGVHECEICCHLTDNDTCAFCRAGNRDNTTLCVVEDPRDLTAIERTGEYTGAYHVLHGAISPMDGIGPEQLRLKQLLTRVADSAVKEVIMATNPTVEGEATALYLAKLLKPFEVRVTRLAYGIPVGGDLELADEVTLRRSLEGRSEL